MSTFPTERILGAFSGSTPGPLLVVIGAVHGNEPAGVLAIQAIIKQLETEQRERSDFFFRGKIVGLVGNLQAYRTGMRFLEQDLNRAWRPESLEKILAAPTATLAAEALEVSQLFHLLVEICRAAAKQKIVFLDLHTTSAEGGVFSIPVDGNESLALAKQLGAPAIMGLQKSIDGTFLKFASEGGFTTSVAESSAPLCVAFESGQHESAQSVWRAQAAITRCLRALGSIGEDTMKASEAQTPVPLWPQSPPVLELRYSHHIGQGDGFRMRPGYANFQPIQKGEHLADDIHGPVHAPEQGLILMPLYQPKGSDGFFIVK